MNDPPKKDFVPRSAYEEVVRGLHQLKDEMGGAATIRERDLKVMLDAAMAALEQIEATPHCRHARINARAAIRFIRTMGYAR